MKKIIGTLFMITVLFITFSSSDYVDAASYDTKASINFIESEEEESSEGDNSEAGDIPGGDIVDGQDEIVDSSESDVTSPDAGTLPKTATNIYSFLLLGFLILLAGISFLIYSNRKEKKKLNQNMN